MCIHTKPSSDSGSNIGIYHGDDDHPLPPLRPLTLRYQPEPGHPKHYKIHVHPDPYQAETYDVQVLRRRDHKHNAKHTRPDRRRRARHRRRSSGPRDSHNAHTPAGNDVRNGRGGRIEDWIKSHGLRYGHADALRDYSPTSRQLQHSNAWVDEQHEDSLQVHAPGSQQQDGSLAPSSTSTGSTHQTGYPPHANSQEHQMGSSKRRRMSYSPLNRDSTRNSR